MSQTLKNMLSSICYSPVKAQHINLFLFFNYWDSLEDMASCQQLCFSKDSKILTL